MSSITVKQKLGVVALPYTLMFMLLLLLLIGLLVLVLALPYQNYCSIEMMTLTMKLEDGGAP